MSRYISLAARITAEMAEAEANAKQLKKQLSEITSQNQDEQLAEALHSCYCKASHTNQCGWGYEKDWQGPTRRAWLARAHELQAYADDHQMSVEEVLKIRDDASQIVQAYR